ncbi:class I SAM-dependent methyltransferase [Agaribacterium sp. ZY112]|uniref:class I SAM-dependent methyltransferase n=1 Tax=Agaribacterium sp. ZY112 TaxID=3233574 RepID=UPI003525C6D7
MKKEYVALVGLSALLSFGNPVVAQDWSLNEFQKEVQMVMDMPHRTDEDRARDNNRNPVSALDFIGLKPDMKVLEFGPGDGWYTKILGPLLKDKGELYIAYRKEWLDFLDPLLKEKPLASVKKLPVDINWSNESMSFIFGRFELPVRDVDMLLCIREYHNFSGGDRMVFNKQAFKALKPGGRYVVIDHTRRHMQKDTYENYRREDPVDVILEAQAAGFVLDKSSDMFYRADDELRYEVGRKTVAGNTDRFTLVFKKPI